MYRKTHSFAADVRWAKDGDLGLPVWETPLGTVGILICMDAGYFEPARLLALAGADVLCFPTNWLGEKSPAPAWIVRAWENGCFLIGANRYGLERGVQFSGGSCVLSPDGTIQALQDTGDAIVYGEVSPAVARGTSCGTNEKLAARRPELYDTLTLNKYLWHPLEVHGLYGHQPLPVGRRSTVAVVQLTPWAGDPAANLALVEQALAASDAAGVELAVFPEYALTGCPGAKHAAAALAADEAATWHERLAELARRYELLIAIGYAERSGDRFFSAALLAGPEGVVARYRKTHILGDEAAWCSPGTEKPPVVDLPLGRVGLLLGSDLCFPELPRSLAIEGCDLLVVPAGPGLPSPFGLGPAAVSPHASSSITGEPLHFHLARQRAFENNCYLAFASLPCPDGAGHSAVFVPSPAHRGGETVLGSCASGVVVRAIDTTDLDAPYPSLATVRTKELVRMRRPELYDALHRTGTSRP